MPGADKMRHGYHDLSRRELLELIPTTSRRILDLGCGTGALGKALKERQACHVTGIELNKEACEIAKTNLDSYIQENLNRYDPTFSKARYDCIIFADILEHLVNPWTVLKKFASVLTDDGVIIASIPNVAHPSIVNNLQRGLWRYEPAGILDITHLRFFTKTSVFQLFCRAGLKIIEFKSHPSDKNPIQHYVKAVKPQLADSLPITTILILTHNGWEYTKQCINSIKRKTGAAYKIIVIDNNSTDGTVEELRKDTTLYHIENSNNLGFPTGFNVGLMLVDTPYFVICNSDVVVTGNWLSKMIKHIELDKDVVLLGAMSNHVSGPQKVNMTPYKGDIELDRFAEMWEENAHNYITYCNRIVFFFTLFKKVALEKIGFLDEIFGMGNFEDDDYCMRAIKKGFKTAFDNTVFIHHYGSRGFTTDMKAYRELLKKNAQIFLKKWNLTEYLGIKRDDTK